MNCAEIVSAVARLLGKLLIEVYGEIKYSGILKLCEIIVFIIYVSGISV